MRHQKVGVKLNRTGSHRNAMFRNMVTSLFKHERISTTDAKAKELRRWADKMITLAKRGDLHARRQAMAVIREKAVVHKLFEEAQARFGERKGGYTRIVKMGFRPGDAASMSLVELIDQVDDKSKKTKKKAKAKKTASTPAAAEKAVKAPEKKIAVSETKAEAAPEATAEIDPATDADPGTDKKEDA